MYPIRVSATLVALLGLAGFAGAQPIPVIVMADDAQDNNWEEMTTAAFQAHMQEDVPLSLGVIPCAHGSTADAEGNVTCLQDTTPPVFHNIYKNWITNNPGMFEVVQHGATHHTNERLANFDRPTQLQIMSIGLDRMASWNLPKGMPAGFNAPFASANLTTIDVAEQLGHDAFVKASATFGYSADELELYTYPVFLCKPDGEGNTVDGAACEFWTPEEVVQMVNDHSDELVAKGKDPTVVVLYHVQDLLISDVDGEEAVDPAEVAALRGILERLRSEEVAGNFDLKLLTGGRASSGTQRIVTGLGAGEGGPEVRLFDVTTPSSPTQIASFFAYNAGFGGGVNVAGLDGDRVVTGPGSGGGPNIRFFDVSNPASVHPIGGFFPYPKDFRGGVSPSTGDVDNDGDLDLATAPGAGGEPLVRVFEVSNTSNPTEITSFFAYNPTFRGAVNTATGDVNGDGFADVITGPVGAGGPHVRVFDVSNPSTPTALDQFFAYSREFRGGVFVGAGDVDGDGDAEVITVPAIAGGPHVRVFDWNASTGKLEEITGFFPYRRDFRGGVRVGAGDVDGDGRAEVITGPGRGHTPRVRVFDVDGGSAKANAIDFLAYPAMRDNGIFVAGMP